MGHQVDVVTSDRSGNGPPAWSVSIEHGVRVHWFPVSYGNHMGFLRRMLAFISFAVVSARRAAQIETDIILATSTPLTIAIPAVVASRVRKAPMVFEVADLWPDVPIAMGIIRHPLVKFVARSLEKWAYNHSTAVVALSPAIKEGVVASGFPASNVAVITNACDFELFETDRGSKQDFFRLRPYLQGHPILLYAGTFGAVNRVSYAVELASELLAIGSEVAVLLVGSGKEKDRVRSEAAGLGVLGVNCFIEDAVPKTRVVGMFSSATCIANLVAPIPALYANSANKFFDGLAAGKPVLVNFDGWMTELIRKRGCGIDTSGMSTRDAAKLVDAKLHDRFWLSESQAEAKVVGRAYFSRDHLVTQLDQVIRAVHSGEPQRSEAISPGVYS